MPTTTSACYWPDRATARCIGGVCQGRLLEFGRAVQTWLSLWLCKTTWQRRGREPRYALSRDPSLGNSTKVAGPEFLQRPRHPESTNGPGGGGNQAAATAYSRHAVGRGPLLTIARKQWSPFAPRKPPLPRGAKGNDVPLFNGRATDRPGGRGHNSVPRASSGTSERPAEQRRGDSNRIDRHPAVAVDPADAARHRRIDNLAVGRFAVVRK